MSPWTGSSMLQNRLVGSEELKVGVPLVPLPQEDRKFLSRQMRPETAMGTRSNGVVRNWRSIEHHIPGTAIGKRIW